MGAEVGPATESRPAYVALWQFDLPEGGRGHQRTKLNPRRSKTSRLRVEVT
jgi:hypothetical protein